MVKYKITDGEEFQRCEFTQSTYHRGVTLAVGIEREGGVAYVCTVGGHDGGGDERVL